MPKPNVYSHRIDRDVPLSLVSILLVEVDPVLRNSGRLLLSPLDHPVLAICAYVDVVPLPPASNCRLATIGMCPSEHEAARTARHVRRTWPRAKILLLGHPSDRFDDPLYDDSVMPSCNPAGVAEAARRLLRVAL